MSPHTPSAAQPASPAALDGLRVLDLSTGTCGAQATTVLADFGAEVLRVKGPAGDSIRTLAASPFWLRGKRTIAVDLGVDPDRDQLNGLIADADVVVVDGNPERTRRRGLDAATLRSRHPRLIHCSITGFGTEGTDASLPGFEGAVAARSGRMSAFDVQLGEDRPVYAAVQVGTHLASQGAVQGILAALLQRNQTGEGDRVETSLLQAFACFDLVDLLAYQLHERDGRSYTPLRHANPMPTLNYHPLRTSDGGWIQCGNLLEHLFYSFLDAIDLLGEFLIDERYQSSPATWAPDAIEDARDRILTRMQEHTTVEWMQRFDENGNVAAEPVISTAEAIDHRDIASSLVTVDDPHCGATTQIGAIAQLSATPAKISASQPADTAESGFSASAPRPTEMPTAADRSPGRPLEGVTIVDLSTIIAGPLGVAMLADLGARVIKVEPQGGDPFRQLLIEGRMAVKTNVGKESICIDLKTEQGQAVLHRMVTEADVLVHNFRGPVPAKLGIDPATLHKINPRLVWTVVNGYSATSPSALRPATHPVMGASTGGVAWQAGDALMRDCASLADVREASRQIMAANEANPDPNTSVVVASAILLALAARDRHPDLPGQVVRVDMQTANAWANADDFLRYDAKPDRPPVDPDHRGLSATYRLYPCASGWVFLAAPTDRWFRRLCETAGWGFADEARFATAEARAEHDHELGDAIDECLRTESADHWQAIFTAAGVAVVRADSIDVGTYWATDPTVEANGWAPEIDHARFGRVRRWAPLATVGGGSPSHGTSPLAGEHTDALLREFGHSTAEIADLHAAAVVGNEPV